MDSSHSYTLRLKRELNLARSYSSIDHSSVFNMHFSLLTRMRVKEDPGKQIIHLTWPPRRVIAWACLNKFVICNTILCWYFTLKIEANAWRESAFQKLPGWAWPQTPKEELGDCGCLDSPRRSKSSNWLTQLGCQTSQTSLTNTLPWTVACHAHL